MQQRAMQDILKVQCFGCGSLNPHGLQIKSFWDGDEVVCAWRPQAHHIGYPGILYGGLIAAVVDCHAMWTATAHAYRRAGEEMAPGVLRHAYVTASLKIDYRKPAPIGRPLELRARVTEFAERKAAVRCEVQSDGVLVAQAELLAVRAPAAVQPL